MSQDSARLVSLPHVGHCDNACHHTGFWRPSPCSLASPAHPAQWLARGPGHLACHMPQLLGLHALCGLGPALQTWLLPASSGLGRCGRGAVLSGAVCSPHGLPRPSRAPPAALTQPEPRWP